jgi:hypothetical protein
VCGIEFEGKNIVKYFYNERNLIDSIQIFDSEELYRLAFVYDYEYENK